MWVVDLDVREEVLTLNIWELRPRDVGKFVKVTEDLAMMYPEDDAGPSLYGTLQPGCYHFKEQETGVVLPFNAWDDVTVLEDPAE